MIVASLAAIIVAGWPLSAATVAERLRELGPAARQRLEPFFDEAGVAYPPASITLVGLKGERLLDVYAANRGGAIRFVRSADIRAALAALPAPERR